MERAGVFQRQASRAAAGLLVAVALGTIGVLWFLTAAPGGLRAVIGWPTTLAAMVALGVTGAMLVDRRPDLPFGWLLAGAALTQVVFVACVYPSAVALWDGSRSVWARWGLAATTFGFVPVAVQGLVNVRFPTGRVASRGGRVLELGLVVGTVCALAGGFVLALGGSTGSDEGSLFPPGVVVAPAVVLPDAVLHAAQTLAAGTPLVILLGLVAGLGVIARYRHAEGIERQQLKWRATGVVVSLALFPFAVAEVTGLLDPIDSVWFCLTLVIPVLRYRLWAIDRIIRRSFVYALVTITLVATYVLVTIVGAAAVSERVSASVAAAAVAIAFAPVRDRAQRLVDRVVYGNRGDPHRAFNDLDRRLADVAAHGDAVPAIVDVIAETLRLPYVAIERVDGSTMASIGHAEPSAQRWPLAFEGATIASLVACPRRGEDGFDERDQQVLAGLARHAGPAVHAEILTDRLIASRQRLVTAREEERRRMRRDLHDGLGPVLTAVGLNLDAARTQLRANTPAADAHLAQARDANSQALHDIRRLVYGLRPPAIDNLGLIDAIRAETDRLAAGRATVTIQAEDNLPPLPAAIEVAAFRTVVEAVTNSLRHGHARHCEVTIGASRGAVEVDVADNGTSSGPWVAGVGLQSMREQAEELNGTFHADQHDGGGGRVTARLPLPELQP
jgi:two-component system NarL family sensor kinase